jgi:hypothetical protein
MGNLLLEWLPQGDRLLMTVGEGFLQNFLVVAAGHFSNLKLARQEMWCFLEI